MNKPDIKEKPMFVRDGERFKLYLFKDSQKSPFFKNWIWKELAKEKAPKEISKYSTGKLKIQEAL